MILFFMSMTLKITTITIDMKESFEYLFLTLSIATLVFTIFSMTMYFVSFDNIEYRIKILKIIILMIVLSMTFFIASYHISTI